MSYMVLWRATDKPALFESEEYESYKEAVAAMLGFHKEYPWNTYLVVQIETAALGTGENPTLPKFTLVPAVEQSAGEKRNHAYPVDTCSTFL